MDDIVKEFEKVIIAEHNGYILSNEDRCKLNVKHIKAFIQK